MRLSATEVKAQTKVRGKFCAQAVLALGMRKGTKGSREVSLPKIPINISIPVIPMTSVIQSPASTKDTGCLDHIPKPPRDEFNTHRLVHLPNSSILAARNRLANISNHLHHLPTAASVNITSVDNLSSPLTRSHPTIHPGRVAMVDHHDTDAWTQERRAHGTALDAVAASLSLGSNGIVLDDLSLFNAARNLMEVQTRRLRTVEQFANATWHQEDITTHSGDWPSLVTPGPGLLSTQRNITAIDPCPHENLSNGRRRVGEILVRCGVIPVSEMSPIEPTTVACGDGHSTHPVDAPVISSTTPELAFVQNDRLSITALASWTSEWVHSLVIEPYLQGNFCFQYQGKSNRAPASVALRIHRVLSDVYNPIQVAIHALWFISMLTGNGAYDNAPPPFLSIPIFRYLHNNGSFAAEDFMFRAFITCAMIGDKTVNDITLSTNTWSRLTRIPQAVLNATEKYALNRLGWNVVMTQVQWQDTIIYLRSCIKMGSAFDPFAYDEIPSSSIMACYLDELIDLSYTDESYTSQPRELTAEVLAPQPIRHFTHWEVLDSVEWCPKDDPVINQKPRTIGIAPGVDHSLNKLQVGITATHLLDSILGSSNVPNLSCLAQPSGTTLCGSFSAIGARLAHSIKITNSCQNASWFPSHS